MHRYKGFVLAKSSYREYDELILLMLEDVGMVSAIIRGSKKKNARYGGMLEPFTSYYIEVDVKKGLSLIYGYEKITTYYQTSEALLSLFLYGSQINELIKRVLPEKQAIAGLVSLLEKLFDYIANGKHPELACSYLEERLASYLGVYFVFDHCIQCGEIAGIKAFSFDQGGMLCKNCWDYNPYDIQDISKLKLLIAFSRLQAEDLMTLNLDEQAIAFIIKFWQTVYEDSLGVVLKSQKTIIKGEAK